MIANAQEDKNGNLSDKGNLSVNCGRMIVKNIHDYDQGVTLAIGANFQVQNSQEQTGKGTKEVSFHHAPVKIQFKDHQQVISSTIGLGQVTYGSISGDQLQRDISQHQQITKKQQAEFDSVVHADMPETIFGPKEKGPEITKIPKDELKKALPKMLGSYFAEIFNNMQRASKDVILKGAKIVNIFGAEINIKQLEKNLERNLDWHFGLKLTATEIQEFEQQLAANYQKELKKLVDEKDQEISKNEQQYLLFFENLKKEIATAEANGSNKSALQATLHIAQALYKKEQNAASKEGRAIKDFKEFIQQLNQNIYHDPAFASKIHDNLAKTLLKTRLVVDKKDAIILGKGKTTQPKGGDSKEPETEEREEKQESKGAPPGGDELDIELQGLIKKFVPVKPQYAREIEQLGYDRIRAQPIELALKQDKPQEKDHGLMDVVSDGVKELFGIHEAQANPVAAALVLEKVIEYGGAALISALIAHKLANENNNSNQEQNDFERRRHNDKITSAPSSKQQQSLPSAASFMPDPGDFEPDDEEKQNSFDPSKEGNHDKIKRDERYGKLYRDAKDNKVWYSKDRGGDRAHAGEHWKKFIKEGDKLIHEVDLDMTGKVMNKHKSDTGLVIKWKDLIGIK